MPKPAACTTRSPCDTASPMPGAIPSSTTREAKRSTSARQSDGSCAPARGAWRSKPTRSGNERNGKAGSEFNVDRMVSSFARGMPSAILSGSVSTRLNG